LTVLPNKKSAIVRCLLTQKTRQIHIQDAKFISAPKCDIQQQEWYDIVHSEAKSMFDPTTCREVIENFFEEINQPQVQLKSPSPKKRRRDS